MPELINMNKNMNTAELKNLHTELQKQYDAIKQQKLALDITRGKPSAEQLSLANAMNHILPDSELVFSGVDLRNYGGLEGITAARKLGSELLGLKMEEVIAAGNSSLTLMYQAMSFALLFGPAEGEQAWLSISKQDTKAKFICPVPGYDRHFAICEELGIEMIAVAMNAGGPDMDAVEALVKKDPAIRGMWCVPKYSNPDGCVYSDETVERIARLGLIAHKSFRVFWDNAYAVHDLADQPPVLANIMDACRQHNTQDTVLQFTSTSKITFAGAGLAWMGASERNIKAFLKHLGISTIGADKVNQARHVKFLPDLKAVQAQMQKHAAILKPRFDCVLNKLEKVLGSQGEFGRWGKPQGGYFVSFDTLPGLAARVVQLANDAGVKLTPAGSTHPYKKDPDNKTIRLAPSFPTLAELDKAMDVFVLCVQLATVEQKLK
jgi:DNA-binding transcriptional MocR family regulator